jgi:hypothetical protein
MIINGQDDAKNFQCLDESGESCFSKVNGEFILKINSEKLQA